METQNSALVIDAGNTHLKLALFRNGTIFETKRIDFKSLNDGHPILSAYANTPGILSSVLSVSDTNRLLHLFPKLVLFDATLRLPIALDYDTPDTLGRDRICNAVGSWYRNQNKNSVSIDIGTCIKFDFVTADGRYQGGSIAPGVALRYRSMHAFTANLPLLDATENAPLIGKSTAASMHSGVMNGMRSEINDLLLRYSEQFEDLTFFMTGGDAKYFDFHSKNNIFAIENLTLEGLYQIYLFNAE